MVTLTWKNGQTQDFSDVRTLKDFLFTANDVSPGTKKVLNERLADLEANPEAQSSWKDVQSRLVDAI